MKNSKIIVSMLIVLCMVLAFTACTNGSFDVSQSNSGGGSGNGETEKDWGNAVCRIGDIGYESIAAAIEAAGTNESEITMLKDTVEAVEIPQRAIIMLDLNGHKVSWDGNESGQNLPTIKNHGFLILTSKIGKGILDGSIDDTVTDGNGYGDFSTLLNWIGGRAILTGSEDGKGTVLITRNSDNDRKSSYHIYNRGTMAIRDGVYVVDDSSNSWQSMINTGHYSLSHGDLDINPPIIDKYSVPIATLTIEGGVFDGGKNTFKVDSAGKLIINGGTITGRDCAVLNWNLTEISGGTFTVKNDTSNVISCGIFDWDFAERTKDYANKPSKPTEQGEITITGGTFKTKGENSSIFTNPGNVSSYSKNLGKINISGGIFEGKLRNAKAEYFELYITSGNFTEDFSIYPLTSIPSEASLKQDTSDNYWKIVY